MNNHSQFLGPRRNSSPCAKTLSARIAGMCGIVITASSLHAAVKPNSLFTEGAVLQQGIEIPVWGTANEGEKVTVKLNGQTATTEATQGRWMVRLEQQKAGGPYELEVTGENNVIAKNIMIGEVWLCSGQSNMQFALKGFPSLLSEAAQANNPSLRFFTVGQNPSVLPASAIEGRWIGCTPQSAADFSATGYFFGRDLQKAVGVTVGLIRSARGGTPAQAWTSLEGLEAEPELAGYVAEIKQLIAAYPQASAAYAGALVAFEKKNTEWNANPESKAFKEAQKLWSAETKKALVSGVPLPPHPVVPKEMPKAPKPPYGYPGASSVLYNGMIAPLVPFAIKGVVWYQGEGNNHKPAEYQTLFPRLIQDWRQKWGQNVLPFLFVQLAPFKELSPEIREAQLVSWKKTPGTSMVVTVDVGDADDIHPKYKEPVGARLALAARAIAYGERIIYSGPVVRTHTLAGDRVVLSFDHVGSGLIAKDGPLRGFSIAGADKNFRPAAAEIQGERVLVSSPEVTAPVAVRYGWANVPDVNLFNREGLPASPFRTDVP
jgi:sialate O-acetylesterase